MSGAICLTLNIAGLDSPRRGYKDACGSFTERDRMKHSRTSSYNRIIEIVGSRLLSLMAIRVKSRTINDISLILYMVSTIYIYTCGELQLSN